MDQLNFDSISGIDLKTLYNAPKDKLQVVITKLDELIKHAEAHETELENNVSSTRTNWLNKQARESRDTVSKLRSDHKAKQDGQTLLLAKIETAKAKQSYDTADTAQKTSNSKSTLKSLYMVKGIIATLMTGTSYPTSTPTSAPSHAPTAAPTVWVAPTVSPPTAAPTIV